MAIVQNKFSHDRDARQGHGEEKTRHIAEQYEAVWNQSGVDRISNGLRAARTTDEPTLSIGTPHT